MPARKRTTEPSLIPVAEYVRMSTEHQKYSIENQQAFNRAYAAAHNMVIVRTYVDAGKSGLTLRGRAGLSALLADVISGTAPFKAILVYDVSRWGRFQDADESAHYEFLCRRAGISMVYCAEQFAADTTPLASVLKSLKRAMAGEFSRELGVKVSAGKARIGKMGFRIGGPAGYGLRRQLLRDGTVPSMLLQNGQRKSIQTDRVTLVPGPVEEINLIRRIYLEYIYLRKSEREIARELTGEGHTFFGRPWSRAHVRNVLSNEKYIGNNIVGRVSARLYTRQVTNPREKWTRCERAFAPLVPKHLFEAAEKVRRFNERVYVSHDDIRRRMRAVLKREGSLTAEIINRAPELPSANTVAHRFGRLSLAYEAVGYVQPSRYRCHAFQRELELRCANQPEKLVALLNANGVSAWISRPRVLSFGDLSTLEVMNCRWQRRHGYDGGWRISYQKTANADFIVAARFNADADSVNDYLLVPSPDLSKLPVFLRASHQGVLARYTYKTLEAVAKKLADSLRRRAAAGSASAALQPRNTAMRSSE
jgi:DNA invertase Pin-like site-specific DNA recombinase